jgi:hypothetical protein
MNRPGALVVGGVVAALLLAGIGASAHTGLFVTKSSGVLSGVAGEEASAPRVEPTETPEPTEKPKAPATAEPTETPEPADTDTETNDEQQTGAQSESGDHEGDSGSSSGGGGEHGD